MSKNLTVSNIELETKNIPLTEPLMVAAQQAALRKKDQSSVLWAVAQNLKVKKEEFSSNKNFFIVEKYIVAYSIVDVVKYLEFIEYKRISA